MTDPIAAANLYSASVKAQQLIADAHNPATLRLATDALYEFALMGIETTKDEQLAAIETNPKQFRDLSEVMSAYFRAVKRMADENTRKRAI